VERPEEDRKDLHGSHERSRKTLTSAYSPRGAPGAPVSMPLTWEELAKAHPLDFRITNAAERLAQTGDRWREALTKKQSLERALESAKA